MKKGIDLVYAIFFTMFSIIIVEVIFGAFTPIIDNGLSNLEQNYGSYPYVGIIIALFVIMLVALRATSIWDELEGLFKR